ncbi:MAG: hypothetical protein NTV98_02605 [Candidatus Roizmanbacteria bacterium]|nr:hypothetical protein [Candidatus Roizmanbacteria bacterium]
MRKTISVSVLAAFLMLQVLPYLPVSVQNIPLVSTLKKASIFHPAEIDAVGISSASATLTNPRLSFHGLVNATIAAGANVAVVKNSGAGGDYNTRNIFPMDGVKIDSNAVINVASVSSDLVTFTLKTPLVSQALANTNMTVAQGGQLKVQIFTASNIPANGSIKISVPAPNEVVGLTTDGIPLAETALTSSGFDTNGMTNANITCPGTFSAGTFTAGASGAPHTFTCNNGASPVLAGTPLTVIIGDNSKPLINPAPISGAHAQGVADIYNIKTETYSTANGGGSLLEDGFARTAPIEGVLVTATVDETLQFTIAGVASGASTYCGQAHSAGITTTATAVPWGTLGSGYVIDKNEAVQQLIVTTNAASGYKVYAEENDQMGDEGAACAGSVPSVEPYTFTGPTTCIKDVSVGSISHLVAADWGATPGTNYGFGYATQGTDSVVSYSTGGTYMARQFADQQAGEDKYAAGAEVMTNSGPVSASAVYVCYRINIPGTQPAGYYYNKLKYTAVPKF